MKRLSSLFSIMVLSLTHASSIYAASDDVANFGDLTNMVERLIRTVGALAGVGLFIALVMGGFTFLFSGGDAKKLESAKNSITYALIGIVVIAGAYLIIQLISQFTGVTSIKMFDLNLGQ